MIQLSQRRRGLLLIPLSERRRGLSLILLSRRRRGLPLIPLSQRRRGLPLIPLSRRRRGLPLIPLSRRRRGLPPLKLSRRRRGLPPIPLSWRRRGLHLGSWRISSESTRKPLPKFHLYMSTLLSCSQDTDNKWIVNLSKHYLTKTPPENVDLVVPTIIPEIWGNRPHNTTEKEKRLMSVRRMTKAALTPKLQVCSPLTTAVEKG